jgi:hypothetical protein
VAVGREQRRGDELLRLLGRVHVRDDDAVGARVQELADDRWPGVRRQAHQTRAGGGVGEQVAHGFDRQVSVAHVDAREVRPGREHGLDRDRHGQLDP